MKRNREVNIFSLSFLDAVSCAFGAVIILFVLSKGGAPLALERVRTDFSSLIEKLERELHELRGETAVLNRELDGKKEQLSEKKVRLARLQRDLSTVEAEFAASEGRAEVRNELEGELTEALQELTEEMERLLENVRVPVDNPIGGVPVDSEYIIFVIDTSGSMQTYAWPLMLKKMREILDIYPEVKGIQVLNDMGDYLFSQYAGRWIPDTPARRRAILSALSSWRAYSNSSPVEGIAAAIRTYYDPDKKISIYVLGDEFSGVSIHSVVSIIDQLNQRAESGARLVRIHAVGFPVLFQPELKGVAGLTGDRFATLMRALCERNGGAFVGLNTVRP